MQRDFQLEQSNLNDIWQKVQETARQIEDLKYAVNAVESSLLSGGNPRLITLQSRRFIKRILRG